MLGEALLLLTKSTCWSGSGLSPLPLRCSLTMKVTTVVCRESRSMSWVIRTLARRSKDDGVELSWSRTSPRISQSSWSAQGGSYICMLTMVSDCPRAQGCREIRAKDYRVPGFLQLLSA